MADIMRSILPDDETREVLRAARRVSRQTGIPAKELIAGITRLIAFEQLRVEAQELAYKHNDGPETV